MKHLILYFPSLHLLFLQPLKPPWEGSQASLPGRLNTVLGKEKVCKMCSVWALGWSFLCRRMNWDAQRSTPPTGQSCLARIARWLTDGHMFSHQESVYRAGKQSRWTGEGHQLSPLIMERMERAQKHSKPAGRLGRNGTASAPWPPWPPKGSGFSRSSLS